MPSPSVNACTNALRTVPSPSRAVSSTLGFATLTTPSAPHGSPSTAPASTNASSVNPACAPAPDSTTTSKPLSRETASGTSATRRSPWAVSFGTPTRTRLTISHGRGLRLELPPERVEVILELELIEELARGLAPRGQKPVLLRRREVEVGRSDLPRRHGAGSDVRGVRREPLVPGLHRRVEHVRA